MSARARAIFLDLQGTLGGDGLGDVRDFEFYPVAPLAVKLINQSPFLAIVITNQSRIGKGFLSYAEYEERLQGINAGLARHGAHFDGVYCCPHTTSDACECKKPLPGLINRAVKDFNIDVQDSYVIGDMGAADMRLADSIGSKGVLVLTGVGKGSLGDYRSTWAGVEPVRVAENVLDAVRWIMHDSAASTRPTGFP